MSVLFSLGFSAMKPQVHLKPADLDRLSAVAQLAKRLKFLNCFITEIYDQLIAEKQSGTSNLLVAYKDCFCTKDVRTTCGSKMLANFTPPYSATVVQRLLDRGALLVGKTNMDEFSMGASSTHGYFGPVKNPWSLTVANELQLGEDLKDDWHIAGGSSGGSAVAVACGLADVAFGSDTGGSTRNPAAFCGVVGYKPTYGLLSRHGLIPLVNSLDVPGILAKSVETVAQVAEMVAGRDLLDSTSVKSPIKSFALDKNFSVKGMTIGVPKEYYIPGLSNDVLHHWNEVALLLESEGAKIREVSLPHTQFSIVCYHVIGECEVASNMARFDGVQYGHRAEESHSSDQLYAESRHSAFNEVVRRRILAGNYFLLKRNYQRYYSKATKVRRLIAEDFYRLFRQDKVDLLLTPVTSGGPPLYSQFLASDRGYERERIDDFFTQPANMAGIPVISVPVGLSKQSLPIGLQLSGDLFDDVKLLNCANWLQQRLGFPFMDVTKYLRR